MMGGSVAHEMVMKVPSRIYGSDHVHTYCIGDINPWKVSDLTLHRFGRLVGKVRHR